MVDLVIYTAHNRPGSRAVLLPRGYYLPPSTPPTDCHVTGRLVSAPLCPGGTMTPTIDLQKIELFLNKIERSSKAPHRCQRHHPQNQLCDCGRHAPKCYSVSCRRWHAQ